MTDLTQVTKELLEAATPGLEWERFEDVWHRTWVKGVHLDIRLPHRGTDWRWQLGLGYGRLEELLPELEALFPGELTVVGKRACARYSLLPDALAALGRWHAALEASEISAERPARLVTEDRGWAWKTAIFLKQAVSDPTGMGPDLEKISGRLDVDAHDELVVCGRSRAAAELGLRWGDEGVWREHTVPCNAVRDQAVRLAQAGTSTAELADFLLTHLRVVLVTAEEAGRMDSMRTPSGINLRDNMPDGWQWGGDRFARLRAANIELE